jgi:hypothetical protein
MVGVGDRHRSQPYAASASALAAGQQHVHGRCGSLGGVVEYGDGARCGVGHDGGGGGAGELLSGAAGLGD